MNNQPGDAPATVPQDGDAEQEQDEIVAQLAKGDSNGQFDPSLNTLQTGETARGENHSREREYDGANGAPPEVAGGDQSGQPLNDGTATASFHGLETSSDFHKYQSETDDAGVAPSSVPSDPAVSPSDAVFVRSSTTDQPVPPTPQQEDAQPQTPAPAGEVFSGGDPAAPMPPQDVNAAPVELALENGAVASGTPGAVIGKLTVTDPDAADTHSFTLSDDRFDVVEGNLVLKSDVTLDPSEAAVVQVDVTATDQHGASVVETFSVEVVDVPDLSLASGFHAKYFDVDHSLRQIDDINWNAEPTHQDVTSDINYQNSSNSFWEGGSRDTFGVQVNGNVVVDEGGTFKFSLGGDDGALLFVNGEPVIDNDGLHGYVTRTGEIELDPGTHHIEVKYFENRGHAGLKLEWEGPGLDGKELVTAPDTGIPQTVEGVGLTLDVDLNDSASDAQATISVEGLPPGTLLEAGSDSATVGEDGAVDISEWNTDVLTITPPLGVTGEIDAHISVSVETEGGQLAVTSHPLAIQVGEANVASPSAEVTGGFHASYFDVDHSLRRIDDIDWDGTPTHEEMVSDINYENGRGSFWEDGSNDTFGARLEGQVTIEAGGDYTFYAGGDDGVVLFIDGVEVIDNDGLHGFRTRSGEVELEPGTYDIELRYFENYGHAGLKLEWEGPDTNGRELVRADSENSIEQNGTFEMGVTLDGASDTASLEVTGLPPDTILISGDMSAVVGEDAIDLTGWNIDLLEISPPPSFEGMIDGELVVTDVGFNGAEVSSATAFSISVGDVSAIDPDSPEQNDIIMAGDQSDQRQGDVAWDSDLSDDDDASGDDGVMSEAAVVQDVESIADLDTDTHERPEW